MRGEVLHLHPTDTCAACRWLAEHWGQAHLVLGELAVLRPSKFARDPPDGETDLRK